LKAKWVAVELSPGVACATPKHSTTPCAICGWPTTIKGGWGFLSSSSSFFFLKKKNEENKK
jgi:hypothetical protein